MAVEYIVQCFKARFSFPSLLFYIVLLKIHTACVPQEYDNGEQRVRAAESAGNQKAERQQLFKVYFDYSTYM